MVNWVDKSRSIAASKDPPYIPCLTPKLTEHPWALPKAEHAAARTTWTPFSKQARRVTSPQELIIPAPSHVPPTVHFCRRDLFSFREIRRVLSLQIPHLSDILNISITDSAGVALAYHRILSGNLQERARQRSAKLEDFTSFLRVAISQLRSMPDGRFRQLLIKTNEISLTIALTSRTARIQLTVTQLVTTTTAPNSAECVLLPPQNVPDRQNAIPRYQPQNQQRQQRQNQRNLLDQPPAHNQPPTGYRGNNPQHQYNQARNQQRRARNLTSPRETTF